MLLEKSRRISLVALSAYLLVQALSSPGCTPAATVRHSNRVHVHDANSAAVIRLEMPAALEHERAVYLGEIEAAMARVLAWFSENELAVDRHAVVDSAVVFADVAAAKRRMSKHFGVSEEKIPDGFSGTVDGKTLFIVARETYAKTYARLYPDRPWSDRSFQDLIAHELAHRAHALKAKAIFGSEDGMGPRWFFEGLAITCASQFAEEPGRMLSWAQMQDLIARDSQGVLSYPLYGQMFRSVVASFPVRWLVHRAGQKGFVDLLKSDYLPSELVLERPRRPRSRGTVLLVHGSAPFNLDGRIPVAGLKSPYARTDFYKDLAERLRKAGWGVLRYSKPGVYADSVDAAEYAKTDLALLSRQLRNLWRFLPADRPRIVFAWSEGSLHVRALPLDEVDAVILLGGIAINIGDVIRAQGGPPAEALRKELAGKSRLDMLGRDRPVGRLLDELSLEENWKAFEGFERLPILVLHGTADREVPVAQAAVWKQSLKRHSISVVEGQGLGHRLMQESDYDTAPLTKEITGWLDKLWPGKKADLPTIEVRAERSDEAFRYVWGLLGRMPFFKKNGYRVALPQSELFQGAASGKLPLTAATRDRLSRVFQNEVYQASDYAAGVRAGEQASSGLTDVLQTFVGWQRKWHFKTFHRYRVIVTRYGPGGSYDDELGRIIVFVDPSGSARRGPLSHTLVHEMVHIGIEERIVRHFGLTHWEKERLVDRICSLAFANVLVGYRIQQKGRHPLDEVVTKEALDDLPRVIDRYVQRHPRSKRAVQ